MEMELSEPLGQLLRQGSQNESEATELGDLIWHWGRKRKAKKVFESLGPEYSYLRRKGLGP